MDQAARPGGRPRTLAEVAAAAGTSVPTVSKVLRGGTDVSAATRAAVIAAIERVGYAPRRSQPPPSTDVALVDFVLSDVHGSFAHEALNGVEAAATAAGHDVVLTISRHDGAWVQRLLRRRSVGAVISLVDPTRAQLDLLHAAGRRFVLIDPMSRPPAYAASVGVTNWEGGRTAAEHLLGLGHRRFVAIGGERTHLYSQARLDGFRSGLQAVADAELLGETSAHWQREDAAEVGRALLALRPTAVFCCNDLMAAGIYDAAEALGLRIPDDLSVVGFDDTPEATWVSPQLTTVRQPIAELGAAAVRMLLRMTAGSQPAAPREELATSLVVRGSTRSPTPA